MKTIDLRSDTVTKPTSRMREAMAAAEVGDDVFGEDPTTNKLEELAAKIAGKEAAMFVPSGSMANIASLLTHCKRGDEMILGDSCHIFLHEAGGASALGGIHSRQLPTRPDGTLDPQMILNAVRTENVHYPTTTLLCLENTHNLCNGSPVEPAYMDEAADIAAENDLSIHLDGARIFNAAAALDTSVEKLAARADSLSFCFSKGLCAPVGSVLCGTYDFIKKARRNRKMLGGGMRQSGVIAAAAKVALEDMVNRLSEDHKTARELALGINDTEGLSVDIEHIRTNIVYFDLDPEALDHNAFESHLANAGIKISSTGPGRFRAVTHYGIEAGDIDRTLDVMKGAFGRD
jgi:threonine aldolase